MVLSFRTTDCLGKLMNLTSSIPDRSNHTSVVSQIKVVTVTDDVAVCLYGGRPHVINNNDFLHMVITSK